MGKKDVELMTAELVRFKEAALTRGYTQAIVDEVAHLIETFARYGFNKSHSVAYGYLTYWTAVIKARFPAAFYAGWLNVTEDGTRRGWIIEQAARRGIKVLPPDINQSGAMFTMVDARTIRFGLEAVKGMGESFVQKTVRAREMHGLFGSYSDYCYRLTSIPVDKKEALVASGAFDFDRTAHRAFLFRHARTISDMVKNKSYQPGDDIYRTLEPVEPMTDLEMANLEKEYASYHISANPMELIQDELVMMGAQIGIPAEELRGTPAIGGKITRVNSTKTKKGGKQMGFVVLDDGIVQHDITLFPEVWNRFSSFCVEERAMFVRVEVSSYQGKPSLAVVHMEPLELGVRTSSLVVDIGTNIGPLYLAQLKYLLDGADAGRSGVRIWMQHKSHMFLLESAKYKITLTDKLIESLKGIFGADRVTLRSEE